MAKIDLEELNDMQFDVLKEIGNIGAGNATTALSTMLNIKVDMSVPNVALLPFSEIGSVVGSEEDTVVGILLGLEGDINGMMMFIFDTKSAHHLVNSLMMRDIHTNEDADLTSLTEMDMSALNEIGNIVQFIDRDIRKKAISMVDIIQDKTATQYFLDILENDLIKELKDTYLG